MISSLSGDQTIEDYAKNATGEKAKNAQRQVSLQKSLKSTNGHYS